ncbi:hypothetical protein QBK93_33290 [Rhizobium leguminosarum]|uniref:hypothetical protein n=1 Tax=Rhizobium leguminosarum TaxID=384 RepID=UPI0024A9D1C0|nr:hypothetical protein [Rhizobium leguminosarum]MDI5929493.1 hypothetical protein [Rhizobium leguminosarum]
MLITSWFDDPRFETRDLDVLVYSDLGAEPVKAGGKYFPSALSIFASADRPCNDVLRPRRGTCSGNRRRNRHG